MNATFIDLLRFLQNILGTESDAESTSLALAFEYMDLCCGVLYFLKVEWLAPDSYRHL